MSLQTVVGPAWLLNALGAAPPGSVPDAIPPPPNWLPPADSPSPGPPPVVATPTGPVVGTQSGSLPPLAADAQLTALGIIQMLAEYNATKKAVDANWLFDNRLHVVALSCAASGLNRKFVYKLPGQDSKGQPIRVMGAFAMNEIWMDSRLNGAESALGPLATFAPKSVGPSATPALREVVSLSWPGQLYYGLILLDSFRAALPQLLIPQDAHGPTVALWAYWRASSPANQRSLVQNDPDYPRCEAALAFAKQLLL